jgi:hypothetical protein
MAAADLVDDYRRGADLGRASTLATMLAAHGPDAGPETATRIRQVTEVLTEAVEKSAVFQRFREFQDREANLDVRRRVAGLRLMLVGGKEPDWFPELREELALHAKSQWIECERQKPPPMGPVEGALKGRQVRGAVVFKTQLGHGTSEPIIKLAKSLGIPLITPRQLSKESLLQALRTADFEEA